MPEPAAMPGAPETHRLHSLQTSGRTREPAVEAQIQRYLYLSRSLFWQHARQRDHQAPDWVQEETLVVLMRIWLRERDFRAVEQAAELLIARTANKITRQVTRWHLPPQHLEDCIGEIQMLMLEALYSLERSDEFWEVRFWVCLERRINTVARRYRNLAEMTQTLDPILDSQGNETDPMQRFAATTTITPHQQAEYHEALSLLPERERCAFVCYHSEGLDQNEIANLLGVTDRTVRNLLQRAVQRLQKWRDDDLH